MDSNEFVLCPAAEQRGMVERGEVMAGVMIAPIPGLQSGCFWCGEARDVLLFGRLRSETKKAFGMRQVDTAASREVVLNHEPCEACKELMDSGVCFMEATGGEDEPEPTGRYWVVTETCVRKIVKFDAPADKIIEERRSFISSEDAHRVGFYNV